MNSTVTTEELAEEERRRDSLERAAEIRGRHVHWQARELQY
jgi:hypothetical protein